MTSKINDIYQKIDPVIAGWMNRHGHFFLRVSMGVVFIWFGALKFTGISPANELVAQTVYWFPPEVFIPVLGVWEVAIGIGLLIRRLNRAAIFLLLLQMPGTMLPLVLLPQICFTKFPFALTMEGQYIIKNLVLISAAIVIGGTVREEMTQPTKSRK